MDVSVLIHRLTERLFYGSSISDEEMKDQVCPDASQDGEAFG